MSSDSIYTGGRPGFLAPQGTTVYDFLNDVTWVQRGVGDALSWQIMESGMSQFQSPANFGLLSAITATYTNVSTMAKETPCLTACMIPHKAVLYGFRCMLRSGGAIVSSEIKIKARAYAPYNQTNQFSRPGKALTAQKDLTYTFPAVSGGTNVLIGFKFEEPVVVQGGLIYLYTNWDWANTAGAFPTNAQIESRTLYTGSAEIPRDWYSVPTRPLATYDAPDEFGVYQSFDDQGASTSLANDPDAYAWRWFGGAGPELLTMRINWTPIWRAIA